MLFQVIDNKDECLGYYADDKITIDQKVPENLFQTWNYSGVLSERTDVEYAKLFCGGLSLDEACPEHYKDKWVLTNEKLKAYFRSFVEAKVSMDDNCFFQLVPDTFLQQYYEGRNKITEHIFETCDRPENYTFLVELSKLTAEISKQRINIDHTKLVDYMHTTAGRNFVKKVKRTDPYCKYNIFGTKTGRLSTTKDSFPILTMNKLFRGIIKANNDFLIELDFNAAELRTLLSLCGEDQPQEDLHDWNLKKLYKGKGTREEAKKKIFSWLYNPDSESGVADKFYDREYVKMIYWNEDKVHTPFQRVIPCDEHHCISYIIQSTCSDNTLRQMIKLWKLLEGRKSYVAFTMHDSVVVDFSKEDRDLLYDILMEFKETDLGEYVINVKCGENYGEMREL